MKKTFNSFSEFYPYYLAEHSNTTCRKLHYIGTALVLCILAYSLMSAQYRYLWLMPLVGYGFAWVGHAFFERNKPATFDYPLYSLIGDWVMFKDAILSLLKAKG